MLETVYSIPVGLYISRLCNDFPIAERNKESVVII